MKPTTYAIVDIETTGTNPKEDRIIQFGCVLVEKGKIVSQFATDVNPNRVVSKQIQSLTGLSNSRVQKAPYFEDIALTIYNLLAETTFVAHNIYFDYTFLNHELVRCGVPELTIPGIDTVELAQIFLPTETSFRLGDLADSYGLTHDNPHQADSDAKVTAELFLTIEAHMRRLPILTMEQIGKLSGLTGMNTGEYIQQVTDSMRENSGPISDSLQVVDGLAIRKKEQPLFSEIHYGEKDFPLKKAGKQKIFQKKLTYRKEQARLMNDVFTHFSIENTAKDILIEAATGMGKTIGYLFPLSFLATPEKPAIISTVSLLLQQQILTKDIPLLNQILDQPIQATVVKSQRHYIDLQRFKATLLQPVEQKQYALFQMKVLVWLTQTETGDFDELHMTSLNHVFWQEVRHHGLSSLSKTHSFYQEDFLRHLYKKVDQSNFLIVNHAFLAQESLRETPLLPKSDYLLIDEAHHLPEIAEKISDHQFDSIKFKKRVQQLMEPTQLFSRLADLLTEDERTQRLVTLYQQELEELVEEQLDFFQELLDLFPRNTSLEEEQVIFKEQLDALSIEGERAIERLLLLYRELLTLQDQLIPVLEPLQSRLVSQERLTLTQLFGLFDSMKQQAFTVTQWLTSWDNQLVHWVVPAKSQAGGTLHIHDFEAALLPKTAWYKRYKKIMYMGGTLKIGANRTYFSQRLGLPETPLKVIPNPYDYENQARVYVPTEGLSIAESSPHEYTQYLASTIRELAQQENRSILVLFTSHDILQRVYYQLHETFLNQGRELLAQGVSGSREKILKRFSLSDNSILFGADSFWEGIDLPGDVLQIVLVTRLPFDNPKRPLVRARNEFLQAEGLNPFYQESVPRAALKLRQALGRLIRTETDKGVLIVLDRRFLTAKYSRRLQNALPKKLPIQELSMADMLADIQQFLRKRKE
ncbi:DNA polymerase III subunit epsilon [Enterococcus sp. JM4C]|uniref:helicase C-terminal domain-containing protein n=1 Tax=Candidatus Enterococcus huntleyi TaxID=1857217 RepID=UPI00137B6416|nr:helicase C-terminal domain-containing protein [Enterococcus sp. JM4C]KAF1297598.1 DNA polymerase III subunit epsilon [Enterococcus sp. JM4C]